MTPDLQSHTIPRVVVDPARFDQRPQPQNHRSGIASRISHDARFRQGVRVELRQTVHGFGQRLRIRRGKLVPLRERLRIAETKRSAQVHDAQRGIRCQQRGNQFERSLVRSRKKYDFRAARGDRLDRKRPARRVSPAAKLRKKLRQATHVCIALAQKESWLFDVWVPQEKPGQLESRVARYSDDGDPAGIAHRSISSTRF